LDLSVGSKAMNLKVFLVVAWLGFAPAISVADSPLVVEEFVLKVEIRGHSYALEALIVKPAGIAGRLPIALIAHGSPRDPGDRPKRHARFILPQARDLAHRGWLAVAVMRRGFGGSQGPFAEGYACAAPDFRKAIETAAEDIEAIRVAVATRPDADGTRVLGLGVSVGGAAMLAWAATRPDSLVGVVNVSGGSGAFKADRNCDEDGLVSAFASFGARSRVPTLWLYAENDSFFGPGLVRRLHGAYTREGGAATLVQFGPVGNDGHKLWDLFAGRMLWLPALDQFLRAQRLPTWDPRPLDTVTRGLSPQQREVMARYLGAPTEKVLSVSRVRRLAWFWAGSADLQTARQKSLEGCERDSAERCDVVVENFGLSRAR
jgi:pimeloyl-ACP methyl ester carboxylesterase